MLVSPTWPLMARQPLKRIARHRHHFAPLVRIKKIPADPPSPLVAHVMEFQRVPQSDRLSGHPVVDGRQYFWRGLVYADTSLLRSGREAGYLAPSACACDRDNGDALLNFVPVAGWLVNFALVLLGVGGMTAALFERMTRNVGPVRTVDLAPVERDAT